MSARSGECPASGKEHGEDACSQLKYLACIENQMLWQDKVIKVVGWKFCGGERGIELATLRAKLLPAVAAGSADCNLC